MDQPYQHNYFWSDESGSKKYVYSWLIEDAKEGKFIPEDESWITHFNCDWQGDLVIWLNVIKHNIEVLQKNGLIYPISEI